MSVSTVASYINYITQSPLCGSYRSNQRCVTGSVIFNLNLWACRGLIKKAHVSCVNKPHSVFRSFRFSLRRSLAAHRHSRTLQFSSSQKTRHLQHSVISSCSHRCRCEKTCQRSWAWKKVDWWRERKIITREEAGGSSMNTLVKIEIYRNRAPGTGNDCTAGIKVGSRCVILAQTLKWHAWVITCP